MALREMLDAYVKEKYRIEPEILPFSHENYEICRHPDTGRWFAVFIVKSRRAFGLEGDGDVEIVSFRIRDAMLRNMVARQPGYLWGYPSSKWNWTSAVLDETVPFEDICRWIDESYKATRSKTKNLNVPLPKKNHGEER